MSIHPSEPRATTPTPVRSDADAVALFTSAMASPAQAEVLCFLLDASGRGNVVLTVTGAEHPDSVLDVVDLVGRAADGSGACYLVVATVRPDGVIEDDDDWRLDELDQLALGHGLELLEWYVFGPDDPVRMHHRVARWDQRPDRWSVPWVDAG